MKKLNRKANMAIGIQQRAQRKRVIVLLSSVMLLVCCGCPPKPPSQEEQSQAATSHWITVEAELTNGEGQGPLDQDDLNAITQGVPTISTVVAERIRIGSIESDGARTEIQVCGTTPEYLRLLEEGARVKLMQGKFLEDVETEEGVTIIVLSENLADKLFPDADAVGQSVLLDDRPLAVVGVVTNGASWGGALTRDAYVPLKLPGTGSDSSLPSAYDRFRFRVENLDQVENTQAIIQNIMQRRSRELSIRVRSFLSDNK